MIVFIIGGIAICVIAGLFTTAIVVGSTKSKGRHRADGMMRQKDFFPDDNSEWNGGNHAEAAHLGPGRHERGSVGEVPSLRGTDQAHGPQRMGRHREAARITQPSLFRCDGSAPVAIGDAKEGCPI
jgi:hypothetical protein